MKDFQYFQVLNVSMQILQVINIVGLRAREIKLIVTLKTP